MILAISTSSQYAVVAWFSRDELVWRKSVESKRAASNAILSMIEESGFKLNEATEILVDVGPGSFTGVRVGLTLAKMWGELLSAPIYAVSTFDLVNPNEAVAIPSKKSEVYVRIPEQEPTTMTPDEALANGIKIAEELELQNLLNELPDDHFRKLVSSLELVPEYVSQPNISIAKQTHIMGETFTHGQ
ncbi:MAG: tRNA (adenosine(37)-N6)-threonylcarbamoyltransferase complex dimerization subunit type 1 TsaB [Fimbriimonadaceae bacterium]|nr:MAG: tRNA (adenosine(37)-N6)-threonylcarbamoyltransferase complex dimerization subunit type 1 TsaB [Fimbriimonadaceae bacterium]